MTIEFHCPHCGKLLRTPDNKSGVKANCPGCQEMVTVPQPQAEDRPADEYLPVATPESETSHTAEEDLDDTKPCPMCGATIKKLAKKCRFCGEVLSVSQKRAGVWNHTEIDMGEVFETTWKIYKKQFGLILGGVIIWMAVPFVVNIVTSFVQQIVAVGVAAGARQGGGGGGQQAQAAVGLIMIGMSLVGFAINYTVQQFMQGGGMRFLLRIILEDNAEIPELFSGKPYLLRLIGGGLLYGLMITVGLIFLIIPGIILALMFWPFMYIIVDRDVGVMESFEKARQIMSRNYLTIFVLSILAALINLGGMLVLCVGIFFTIPFTYLLFAVAYAAMTGQISTSQE
ncbi:MAG: hypothetical protein JSS02_23710 [Planctomycetes bacterium]|nr:hypothetical protein [Planctomycetota bacterium]